MGVHGEPGAETILISHFEPASFTTQLVNHICSRLDLALSTNVGAQDDVCTLAILVNNLGAVPQSEMLIAAQAVSDFLFQGTGDVMDGNKHDVYMFIGSYMTSLQMNGLSISCLVIPNTANSSHMRDMLLAPTTCWSWNAGFKLPPPSQRIFLSEGTKELTSSFQMAPDSDGNRTEICISAITSALLERCEEFGQLDQRTGDGDFGITGMLISLTSSPACPTSRITNHSLHSHNL